MKIRLLLLAAVVSSAVLAAEPAADTYVVQPGDTCPSVAMRVFGNANETARLHRLNSLGPPPHKLVPGSTLQLRPSPDALLTFIRPAVNARKAGGEGWVNAAVNQGLYRLDEVNTLKSAGAEITFRDLSSLQLRENALVILFGGASKAAADQRKSGEIELVQGELRLSLAQLRGEPLSVMTPAGMVTASSRDVQLDVDASKVSRISVHEGEAHVSAQGKVVRVPAHFGTRVEKGKPPEKPRPLPGAPQWAAGDEHIVRMLLDAEPAEQPFSWAVAPGVVEYRLEVAREEKFNDLVHEEQLVGLSTSVKGLTSGTYFARLSGKDEVGLSSPVSKSRRLDLLRVRGKALPVSGGVLRGQAPMQLDFEVPQGIEARVDGRPSALPLTLSEPGRHEVTFAPIGSSRPPPVSLPIVVLPPAPDLEITRQNSGRYELKGSFGNIIMPRTGLLAVKGVRGTRVGPVQVVSPTQFTAEVFPGEDRVALLEVFWDDFPLGALSTPVDGEPAPAAPVAVADVPALEGVSLRSAMRDRLAGSAPAPTAFLPNEAGVEVLVDGAVLPGAALSGRASIVLETGPSERFVVNAGLTFRGERPAGLSGEFFGAAKVRLLGGDAASLGLAADASAGLGAVTTAGLRAFVVGGLRVGRFGLSTAHGVAYLPLGARANSFAYVGNVQGWLSAGSRVAFTAQLDAEVQLRGVISIGVGGAIGVRVRVSSFELALAVQRGLLPAGEARWGLLGVGLSFRVPL